MQSTPIKPADYFQFDVPVDSVQKGKNKAGEEVIYVAGTASTNHRDHDKEVLEPSGFDTSYFLSHGFINWNHQGKTNPGANIGEPTEAAVVDDEFKVKGWLYPDNPLAKQTAATMASLKKNKSSRKMCWSVEGKVLERDADDPSRVTKLLVTGVALTLNPKNTNTFADIVKGHFEAAEAPEALSLVEVYQQIYDAYPALEKGLADQVYNLVAAIATQTPFNPMTKVSKAARAAAAPAIQGEHVSKALEALGLASGTTPIEGAGDDDEPEQGTIEKSIDSAIELLRQGRSQRFIVKSLLPEVGDDESIAGYVFRQAAAQFAAEEEEEEPTTPPAGTVTKGEDDDDEPGYNDDDDDDEDEDDEPEPAPKAGAAGADKKKNKPALFKKKTKGAADKEALNEVVKGLADELGSKFQSVAVLLDAVLTGQRELREDFSDRLTQLEDAPGQRKSAIVSKGFEERNFAGQNADNVNKGMGAQGGRQQLSLKSNRDQVLDLLEGRVDYKNLNDPMVKKAANDMTHFENVGTISKAVADELNQKHGIELVP